MQIHPLTDQLSVAAQIGLSDLADLAAQGFRSVINNRPDGEADGQPGSAILEAAARDAGLAYRYLPLVPGQLPDSLALAFATALAELPAPVLAFCRSGHRSSMLWALQDDGSVDDILATARDAGYDLSALRSRLGGGA